MLESIIMRLAVLSDIHGNLEALKQVLADMKGCRIDQRICLGDMVGYGPDPEAVVRLIRKLKIPSVLGNHELALIKPKYLRWFNPVCRESLLRTKDLLDPGTVDYFKTLPPNLIMGQALFVHGCPPDSMLTYLFAVSEADLEPIIRQRPETLFFVGHTHELLWMSFDGKTVASNPLGRETVALRPDRKYVINVGSVGQPRDGDNQAKYLIWDDEAQNIEVRFVPYDIARTARKIIQQGFPEIHARRLW